MKGAIMAQDIKATAAKINEVIAAGDYADVRFEAKENRGGVNVNIANIKELGGNDSAKMRALCCLEDDLLEAGVTGVNARLSQQKSEQQEDGSWKVVGYTQWPHVFVDCRERLSDTVAALAESMAAKDAQIERLLAALSATVPGVDAEAGEVAADNAPDPF
jgi:hypothetical protein